MYNGDAFWNISMIFLSIEENNNMEENDLSIGEEAFI